MVVPSVPKHASRVENEILDAVSHLEECAIKGECENSRTIFRHESSDWTFPDTEVQIRSVVLDSSRIRINLEDSHADQY